MKKHLLIFLFVVLSNALATRSWGQEKLDLKHDSETQLGKLKMQFEQAKEDTAKFMILVKIADMQRRMGQKNEALQSAQECLEIAEKIGTDKYLNRGYSVMGAHYLRMGDLNKSLIYRQKSLEVCERGYPIGLAAACLNLATHYKTADEHKKALIFAKEGIPFARKYNQTIILNDLRMSAAGLYADIYNQKDSALIMYRESILSAKQIKDTTGVFLGYSNMVSISPNLDSSVVWITQAIRLAKQIKYIKWVAASYQKMAEIYEVKGQYNQAILYCDTALTYLNQVKESAAIENQANMLLTLGNLYRLTKKDLDKSEQYYEEALAIYKKRQLKERMATTNRYFGALYSDWRKYDKGIVHILEAIRLYEDIGITKYNFTIRNLLADLYHQQGRITDALRIHRQNIASKVEESAISYGYIAQIYLHHFKDSLPIAKKYVATALAYVKKKNERENILTFSLYAAQINEALGNHKQALEEHKIFARYADSLRNKDNTSLVYEYEAKYDNQKLRAEKAEAEKNIAEADKNIAEEKAAKQKLWFAVVLAASLSVAGFVAYWQQRKRKAIAEQNAEIQKLLAEESAALAEANAQKLEQEQELAQNREELLATQEARNAELAKERAHWLAAMREIQGYLTTKKYDGLNAYVAKKMEPVSEDSATELETILAEMQQNFPQFIPNLIAVHPELSTKPKLQDLAVLLVQNIPIADIANLLFGGQIGTAKNNQRDLRVILNFPAKDYEGVRTYLKSLMMKK